MLFESKRSIDFYKYYLIPKQYHQYFNKEVLQNKATQKILMVTVVNGADNAALSTGNLKIC